jgi:uncharacterized membrane protein YeaQ/YmgE (transglycosylase-associated protein family)
MAVFFWVILGLLVGAIAKLVVWDGKRTHWAAVMLLGAAGAVLGGRIAGVLMPNSEVPGFDLNSIVLALIGPVILLAPYGIVFARRRATTTPELESPRRAA